MSQTKKELLEVSIRSFMRDIERSEMHIETDKKTLERMQSDLAELTPKYKQGDFGSAEVGGETVKWLHDGEETSNFRLLGGNNFSCHNQSDLTNIVIHGNISELIERDSEDLTEFNMLDYNKGRFVVEINIQSDKNIAVEMVVPSGSANLYFSEKQIIEIHQQLGRLIPTLQRLTK